MQPPRREERRTDILIKKDYKAEIVTEAQEGREEVIATGGPGLKVGDALELYASVNATRK